MGSIARIPAWVLEKSVFLCIPPEDGLGGGGGGGGSLTKGTDMFVNYTA